MNLEQIKRRLAYAPYKADRRIGAVLALLGIVGIPVAFLGPYSAAIMAHMAATGVLLIAGGLYLWWADIYQSRETLSRGTNDGGR